MSLETEMFVHGLTILLFLLISAFFSGAETAMTAVSRARIYQLVMDGNRRAQIVSRLRRHKESLIGAVLLGNNAVNIAASAIATSLTLRLFGSESGLVIATLAMTLLVVVFTEVLPKTYAIQNAERTALALAPALNLLVRLLYPVTQTIYVFIRLLLRLAGADLSQSSRPLVSATDVIRGTIELHHREGRMIKQDRDMLGSILDLNDIEVRDIMIHRKDVEMIEVVLSAPEPMIQRAVSTMHSRIPLWQGEPDNIVGLLHVKNLVQAMGASGTALTGQRVLELCTKPWFIPETTSLRNQLLAFRAQRQHFAFVVDEYGAWKGIVTLEDIIEEIVGNIDDEHDEERTGIEHLDDGAYMIDGDVTLRDLKRHLDWTLPDEHASTVAGLVIHEAQTLPSVGEHFQMHGFRFTVAQKEAAQITRLHIRKLSDVKRSSDVEP